MKAVWKGYLGFGMVTIPVSLYSAIGSQKFSFRLLHNKDDGPINYKRVCSKCGVQVDWEEIAKGIKVGKEEFIVLAKEELDELKPKGDDLIEVKEFVDSSEIKPIYIKKHYYLGPGEGNKRAFYLFREILENEDKSAICVFVMRENEYLCTIKNYENGMILTILNYDKEIRDFNNVPGLDGEIKLKEEEIDLAKQLIEKLTSSSFDLSKYENKYAENLKEAVRKKVKGESYKMQKTEITETENLIDALKASVNQ